VTGGATGGNTTSGGATGGNTTGGKGNTTTGGGAPAALPMKELYNATKDFQGQTPPVPPTSPATTTATTEPVPAGYKNLAMNVTWTINDDAPASVARDVMISLASAAGEIGSCPGPTAGAATVPAPCSVTATNPPAGELTLTFTGTGIWTAQVSVVVY
jgi:hypothetical protein